MAYTYTAIIQYHDSDGRFANLTQSPTVTAYDLDGNAIASPSITNIATGTYKVSVTQNDLEDVIFRVVPHTDDQANFDDVAVMQDKVTHTADEILTDTGTTIPATLTTIDGIVDDILEDTGTTLPAEIEGVDTDVWTFATRTLTQSATSVSNSVSGSSISDVRGDTWSIDVDDLTLDSNLIQFAIKKDAGDTDDESILMIDTTTGLLYLNGAAGTASDGSLSYAGTTLTITVKASATAQIPFGTYVYGIQSITAGGTVAESYGGKFTVTRDVVRSTT